MASLFEEQKKDLDLGKNGFLELLAHISWFDLFLAGHISKYGNSGKGNPFYVSKATSFN